MEAIQTAALKPRDYASDQEVKWCPGCGDYAVHSAVQKAFADLALKKDQVAIISGIGCSSRFPYYMDTYGFHTIHGRAAAVATGVKLANPSLSVWVMTGDGDALAIGGNHFIHAQRRNIDMNMVLFNNEIYGLTKGQHSPTTAKGKVLKSSPLGTIENTFSVGELCLGAGGQFYARVPDTDVKLMAQVMTEAYRHKGFAMIEVLQNCVIFNDKTHAQITGKESRALNQLVLEHGKPMIFGANSEKGIRLNGLELEVITLGQGGMGINDVLVHDATNKSNILHTMLVQMRLPEFPVALGVIRRAQSSVFDQDFLAQSEAQKSNTPFKGLNDLFHSGNTFQIN
ncbi:MAG: 2-oxoacid:ferredoxin oxidoreductase subunit beta [Bacteroidetes bacterium]|nr:2-oxoacid:ferredoxin oxidoreductase subunit beta [Bacteroidota bacterium]